MTIQAICLSFRYIIHVKFLLLINIVESDVIAEEDLCSTVNGKKQSLKTGMVNSKKMKTSGIMPQITLYARSLCFLGNIEETLVARFM